MSYTRTTPAYAKYLPAEVELTASSGIFHMSPYTDRSLSEKASSSSSSASTPDPTNSRPSTAITPQASTPFSATFTLVDQVYHPPRPKTAPSRSKSKDRAGSAKGKTAAPKPRPVTSGFRGGKNKKPAKKALPSLLLMFLLIEFI